MDTEFKKQLKEGQTYPALSFFNQKEGALFGFIDNFSFSPVKRAAGSDSPDPIPMLVISSLGGAGNVDLIGLPLLCPYCGQAHNTPPHAINMLEKAIHRSSRKGAYWYTRRSEIQRLRDLELYQCDGLPFAHDYGLVVAGEGFYAHNKPLFEYPACSEARLDRRELALVISLEREYDDIERCDGPDDFDFGLIITHPASLFYIKFAKMWNDSVFPELFKSEPVAAEQQPV